MRSSCNIYSPKDNSWLLLQVHTSQCRCFASFTFSPWWKKDARNRRGERENMVSWCKIPDCVIACRSCYIACYVALFGKKKLWIPTWVIKCHQAQIFRTQTEAIQKPATLLSVVNIYNVSFKIIPWNIHCTVANHCSNNLKLCSEKRIWKEGPDPNKTLSWSLHARKQLTCIVTISKMILRWLPQARIHVI